jgi:DNA adenine methylase
MTTTGARPPIKWAGGKTQLLPAISALLPSKIQTYYEPFLGGGAVFWHVASTRRFERAQLNDLNRELIETYQVIRDSPEALIGALNDHMSRAWNTQDYFTEMRSQDPAKLPPVARAARMIYLNKTCYNGLYRVNKKGGFNAPFGRYKNPKLLDALNIRECSATLNRKVQLLAADFTAAVAGASPGDLVYFDPPYVPVSETADFTSYTSDGFSARDQDRLALCFKELAKNDVSCILSNSDKELTRKLYEGFEIIPVKAKRNINSKGDGRGHVGEVLVIHRGAAHRDGPEKGTLYATFANPS